ncbi:unnamed protein product [Merluccius merluccius]
MADGLRCKRRKQANPRRNSVTNFNNGLEASSDSDDEDKLHIVEEDSLQEPDATTHATAAAVANGDQATPTDASHDTSAVLAHNGSWNGGRPRDRFQIIVSEEMEEGEEEEEETKDALVEEILQQGDTAVIYPEAPEEECSTPDRGGADENGLPDTFSQLHTCPYCSRGYKRNASLKEHIKYRHETSDDNFSCSQCSYTFTYRSQLERHMSHHKGSREQRHVTPATGGNRKFKCNECAKAFKYKHHLKEHLRIHSGEKPYECSNCKKRFSHSGSYSSHISSKKCVGARPTDGASRPPIKPTQPTPQTPGPAPAATTTVPARILLKEKSDSKPLQEQLPLTQIKSEPVEYECKPAAATANATTMPTVTTMASTTTLPQGLAMVVPTVGLMSPISINLGDLQSVLKVAMDGNVLRQVLGSANGLVVQGKQGLVLQQPQQQIISLPAFVDQDGTTKIIINYSINPAHAAATTNATAMQTAPLLLKRDRPAATAPIVLTTTTTAAPTQIVSSIRAPEVEKAPTDLTVVKTEPASQPPSPAPADAEDGEPAAQPDACQAANAKSAACLLCEDDDGAKALRALQSSQSAEGKEEEATSLDPSFAALLKEAGVTLAEPPADRLVSLLAYFSSNAHPDAPELGKISDSVGLPVDVVRRWFDKMNSAESQNDSATVTQPADSTVSPKANGSSALSQTLQETPSQESASANSPVAGGDLVVVKSEPKDPDDLEEAQAEPLDLSLPKQSGDGSEGGGTPPTAPPAQAKQQEQPLNLSCLRKNPAGTIYVSAAQAGSIAGVGQLPTLVAIAGHQGTISCLRAINTTTKRTILIPQLTYTYTAATAGSTGAKTVLLNGHKERRQDSGSEGTSAVEEQNDSDSASPSKKRRLENGVYPCDLCSKVFQKGSSLLRHKYEHTGKRPHECAVCKKAFKHKHHLIEHSRLHSGEKPYACDKCGKRFSHSGSYSQHMNHRYSYCKKDGPRGAGPRGGALGLGGPGDQEEEEEEEEVGGGRRQQPDGSGTTTPHSQLDSDEKESEEEEGEEEEGDEDDEAMCMEDIRVVQVDDDDCELYEAEYSEEVEREGSEGGGGEENGATEEEESIEQEEEEVGMAEEEEEQEEERGVAEEEQEEEGGVAEEEQEEEGGVSEEEQEEEGGVSEEEQEEEGGVSEEEEEEEGGVAEEEEEEEEGGVAEEEEEEEEGGVAEEEEEEGGVAEEEEQEEEGGVAEGEEQEEEGGVAEVEEQEKEQEEEGGVAEEEQEEERGGAEDMEEVEEMEEDEEVGCEEEEEEEMENATSPVVAVETAEEETNEEGEIMEESKGVEEMTDT